MDGKARTLGGILGATLLTIAALSTASCEDSDGDGFADGPIGDLQRQCGLACPPAGEGVALGNTSITGYAAIDGFFRSVVNYGNVATGVAAEIDAELRGIQSLFEVSEMELATAKGDLGAAISTKLKAQYMASVQVKTTPAKCSVDARVAASATAKCQAQAKCDVDPGKASFQCMGTCNVEANVMGGCEAGATVRCNVTGPALSCMGECSGTCTLTGSAAAKCSGQCTGTCTGGCDGTLDAGGRCSGTCTGTCNGGCELTGMAALNCSGACNGSCEYTKPMGTCEAGAEASCDLSAEASASCTGKCSGEFEPPKATCDASASCEASAKAEARFQVQCTPPSVEVKVIAQAGGMAQARVDFLIAQLRLRMPRLAAATARAKLAAQAAEELRMEGSAAVNATASAVVKGDIDLITGARITSCLPAQLTEANGVIMAANATLSASTGNADSVAKTFGMAAM